MILVYAEGRVGSKGELFLPKKIRDKLGLKPHMRVIYRIEGDKLLVELVPKLEDVLEGEPEVEITLEEFHRFRKELSRRAET